MVSEALQALLSKTASGQAILKAITKPTPTTKAEPEIPTVTSTVSGKTVAQTPVSSTSLSNAKSIASKYEQSGFGASVVSEGGGKYKVVLTPTPPKSTVAPTVSVPSAPTTTTKTTTAPTVTTTKAPTIEVPTIDPYTERIEKFYALRERLMKEAEEKRKADAKAKEEATTVTLSPLEKQIIPESFQKIIEAGPSGTTTKVTPSTTVEETTTAEKITEPVAKTLPSIPGTTLPAELIANIEKQKEEEKITSVVEPTAYYEKYGWKPTDKDFVTAKADVSSSITQVEQNIQNIKKNVGDAKKSLSQLQSNLDAVKSSSEGTQWTADVPQQTLDKLGIDRKETYSRAEMLKIIQDGIERNKSAIAQESDIAKLQSTLSKLRESEKTIKEYEEKGYEIEPTEEGFMFKYPSALEAHVGIFGEEESKALLSSSAFIQSPLAIGTIGSAIQYLITGDESVKKAQAEKLAEYSFGLQEALEKGPGEYVGKVLTSGAVTTGIVIPAITLGAGYGISAISAGASGATATGGTVTQALMEFGGTTLGKATAISSKILGAELAGIVSVGLGVQFGTTLATKPEEIGSQLAETGFAIGTAVAGYKAGQQAFLKKTTTPVTVEVTDPKTGKTTVKEIGRIPKGTDITGKMDIIETKPGKATPESPVSFEGKGTYSIKGRPDVKVTLKGQGIGEPGDPTKSLSQGRGMMEWTETVGGTKKTYVKLFDFAGQGKYMWETGNTKIYEVTSTSEFLAGKPGSYGYGSPQYKPTIGTGELRVTDVGKWKFKAQDIPVAPSELVPQRSIYTYHGDYFTGLDQYGRVLQTGQIATFTEPSPLVSVSGQAPGTIDLGTLGYAKLVKPTGAPSTPFSYPKPTGTPTGIGGLPTTAPTTGAGGVALQSIGLTSGAISDAIGGLVVSAVGTVPVTAPIVGAGAYGFGTQIFVPTSMERPKPPSRTIYPQQIGEIGIEETASALGISQVDARQLGLGEETSQERRVTTGQTFGDLGGTRVGGGQILIEDLGLGELEGEGYRTIQEPLYEPIQGTEEDIIGAQAQFPMTQQQQRQQILQEQQQQLAQASQAVSVVTPIPTSYNFAQHFGPVIPWIGFGREPIARQRRFVKKVSKKAPKQEVKQIRKQFLADIGSVTRSQAIYGKATHPMLTPEQWEKAEKTGYALVETVELQKKKKKDSMLGDMDIDFNGKTKKKKKKRDDFDIGIGGF